jgi:hypothetical protein
MALQVNVRLDETDWEQIVEAMPGLSNGERMTRLVRQQLTLLESRHDLPRALQLVEAALDPTLQALRRQRLQGQGSEVAEELAQSVIEMAALLLAQSENLAASPEKYLPELEAKLARRWSRSARQLLRTAALDPLQIRHQAQTRPELQGVLAEAAKLAGGSMGAALPAPLAAAAPASAFSTETTTPNRG